jgi:hypothetical protein
MVSIKHRPRLGRDANDSICTSSEDFIQSTSLEFVYSAQEAMELCRLFFCPGKKSSSRQGSLTLLRSIKNGQGRRSVAMRALTAASSLSTANEKLRKKCEDLINSVNAQAASRSWVESSLIAPVQSPRSHWLCAAQIFPFWAKSRNSYAEPVLGFAAYTYLSDAPNHKCCDP